MKAWLKGGLIGLGIGILITIIDFISFRILIVLNGILVYELFSDILVKLNIFYEGEVLQASFLIGAFFTLIEFSIIGFIIGFIYGKIKSKSHPQ